MSERLVKAAFSAAKVPLHISRGLADRALTEVLRLPGLPSREDYRNPAFEGELFIVGDSCIVPVMAQMAVGTVIENAGIQPNEQVRVTPVLPANRDMLSRRRSPLPAAERVADALVSQVDDVSVTVEDFRCFDTRTHDPRSLKQLFDPVFSDTQIGVVPVFTAHAVIGNPKVHRVLSDGGAVALRQQARYRAIFDEWVPVPPRRIR